MKKIVFSLTAIAMLSLTAEAASAAFIQFDSFNSKKSNKKKEITIGSNRATGEMLLHFTAEKAGIASINVIDESGTTMLEQTGQVTNGINSISLKNATRLNEGSYTIRLILNNESYTTRFIIWK